MEWRQDLGPHAYPAELTVLVGTPRRNAVFLDTVTRNVTLAQGPGGVHATGQRAPEKARRGGSDGGSVLDMSGPNVFDPDGQEAQFAHFAAAFGTLDRTADHPIADRAFEVGLRALVSVAWGCRGKRSSALTRKRQRCTHAWTAAPSVSPALPRPEPPRFMDNDDYRCKSPKSVVEQKFSRLARQVRIVNVTNCVPTQFGPVRAPRVLGRRNENGDFYW
jgi:hypothetical protein